MTIFQKIKEPIFLKESKNAEEQIEKLKALKPNLNEEGQTLLEQDIAFLEYGIAGEKNIEFELKNSHMPMYILHDIYLKEGDLSAQIDYLVFTNKLCFIIECKNLYGNIEINNAGDFIRVTEYRGRKQKVGIYSPITQNQRHMDLMKKIRINSRGNKITQLISEKYFHTGYKPIVVLSNPKTILNAKFAAKEIKDKVIRADQLVKYIKDANKASKESIVSEKTMRDRAQFYLNKHKDVVKDYTKKYETYKLEKSDTDLFGELKAYRLNKSREEKIRAYYIFSDKQLEDLVSKMPRTNIELQSVDGFGKIKAEKYGNDILKIIQPYLVD
ncbi:hypothetical protein GCM10008932_09960 [Alkalibacterium iburiense]|uniref:HRDC domain-containing protein n=1 Tax=Alkalibacterium iburiense TaxID=290589 RepID=A0ABN0XAH8_9LACT